MNTVEAASRIEMPFLRKTGRIVKRGTISSKVYWSRNGEPSGDIRIITRTDTTTPHARLVYKVRQFGEPEYRDMDYVVPLERVECHFGGFRWYFRCTHCNRRVAILYSAEYWFVCRKCAGLIYDSQTTLKRFRGYPFKVFDIEEYYEKHVKREYYNGKKTKRFKTYCNKIARCGMWNRAQAFADIERRLHL